MRKNISEETKKITLYKGEGTQTNFKYLLEKIDAIEINAKIGASSGSLVWNTVRVLQSTLLLFFGKRWKCLRHFFSFSSFSIQVCHQPPPNICLLRQKGQSGWWLSLNSNSPYPRKYQKPLFHDFRPFTLTPTSRA